MQCDKIRDYFADFLIERLTPADQAVLSRHLHECSSCNAELNQWTDIWVKMGSLAPVESGEPVFSGMSTRLHRAVADYKNEREEQASAAHRLWMPALVAAAAVLIFMISIEITQRLSVPPGAATVVEAAQGSLSRTWGGQTDFMEVGARIEHHEVMRTDGFAGAVLMLAEGSRVEMRAQSELWLEGADDGPRIRLRKGGIVVNAVRQRTGHLYVQTKDMTVSVVGTVFVVDTEEAGSRVAVIEGEVHVQQGGTSKTLLPGEQVTTSPLLEPQRFPEEIIVIDRAERPSEN